MDVIPFPYRSFIDKVFEGFDIDSSAFYEKDGSLNALGCFVVIFATMKFLERLIGNSFCEAIPSEPLS